MITKVKKIVDNSTTEVKANFKKFVNENHKILNSKDSKAINEKLNGFLSDNHIAHNNFEFVTLKNIVSKKSEIFAVLENYRKENNRLFVEARKVFENGKGKLSCQKINEEFSALEQKYYHLSRKINESSDLDLNIGTFDLSSTQELYDNFDSNFVEKNKDKFDEVRLNDFFYNGGTIDLTISKDSDTISGYGVYIELNSPDGKDGIDKDLQNNLNDLAVKYFESGIVDYVAESVNESNDFDIFAQAKAHMLPEEIDHHETDLYLKCNNISYNLVDRYEFNKDVKRFKSDIDGEFWYDISFAWYNDSVNESDNSLIDKIKGQFPELSDELITKVGAELQNADKKAGVIDRVSTWIAKELGYIGEDDSMIDEQGYKDIISKTFEIYKSVESINEDSNDYEAKLQELTSYGNGLEESYKHTIDGVEDNKGVEGNYHKVYGNDKTLKDSNLRIKSMSIVLDKNTSKFLVDEGSVHSAITSQEFNEYRNELRGLKDKQFNTVAEAVAAADEFANKWNSTFMKDNAVNEDTNSESYTAATELARTKINDWDGKGVLKFDLDAPVGGEGKQLFLKTAGRDTNEKFGTVFQVELDEKSVKITNLDNVDKKGKINECAVGDSFKAQALSGVMNGTGTILKEDGDDFTIGFKNGTSKATDDYDKTITIKKDKLKQYLKLDSVNEGNDNNSRGTMENAENGNFIVKDTTKPIDDQIVYDGNDLVTAKSMLNALNNPNAVNEDDNTEYNGVTIHSKVDTSGGQETKVYKAPSINDTWYWDLDKLKSLIDSSKPINENVGDNYLSEYTQKDDKFKYQLLGRMQSDCEYYLGNGGKSSKHLFMDDEAKQIELMKALWDSFTEKPEWISMEEIDDYANQMGVDPTKSVNEDFGDNVANQISKSKEFSHEYTQVDNSIVLKLQSSGGNNFNTIDTENLVLVYVGKDNHIATLKRNADSTFNLMTDLSIDEFKKIIGLKGKVNESDQDDKIYKVQAIIVRGGYDLPQEIFDEYMDIDYVNSFIKGYTETEDESDADTFEDNIQKFIDAEVKEIFPKNIILQYM